MEKRTQLRAAASRQNQSPLASLSGMLKKKEAS